MTAGEFCLAIVGGGPRSTYALERLSATVDRLGGRKLAVHVYDDGGDFGAGQVHSADQPFTSYLNRAAHQVGFAADPSVTDAEPIRDLDDRPTLYEWCRERFAITGDETFDLEPADAPKRYQHGQALREMFDAYADELRRKGVSVTLHAEQVIDLVPADGRWEVVSADATHCVADQVLLITGHSSNDYSDEIGPGEYLAFAERTGAVYVPSAYPLQEALSVEDPRPGTTVGCAGLGLTAIDQILYLTEGRGGRFIPDGDRLRYQAGGAEPAMILAFSPSGVFPYTRPINRKDRPNQGRFLTKVAIDRIRKSSGTDVGDDRPRLDFDAHVMPLILLEMAYVHYRTLYGPVAGDMIVESVHEDYERFLTLPLEPGGIERLLPGVDAVVKALPKQLVPEPMLKRFDWGRILSPIDTSGGMNRSEFRSSYSDFLRRDLDWAAQGNVDNAFKASVDGVWRDLRGVLGYAVDGGGLTADSHRQFLEYHRRCQNKLSGGAAPEVMAKILALAEHGVLDMSAGPGAKILLSDRKFVLHGPVTGLSAELDVLLDARVHAFDPARDIRPLYRNLLGRDVVSLWRNTTPGQADFVPGFLDLDERSRLVGHDSITVLGPAAAARGTYQFSALRPNNNDVVMREIVAWLDGFWAALDNRRLP
ncbi:FAD/NAD(P)-binding protein [Amycolatopsis sp. cg5]|uniref:FAD/NAD(P)-binding protein n=1 Tax=Amycolatopsis sp. cg5 TaxID=3238802 RepID=UPI00352611CE